MNLDGNNRGFSVSGCRGLQTTAPCRLSGADFVQPETPEEAEPGGPILEAAGDILRRGFAWLATSRRGVALRLAVLNHCLFPIDGSDSHLARRLRLSRQAISKVRLDLERNLPELARRGRRAR